MSDDLAHVRRMWAQDTASARMGIELVEVAVGDGLGRAAARMSVTEVMVNGHGIAHGGYLFAFADSTFALACNASGRPTVAAGADVVFVAPAHLGDVLLARAAERAVFGRSGLTDVTVTRERDDALVLEMRGRSRSLPTKETR